MTSELSIFAAQLREFIHFQSEDIAAGVLVDDHALAAHADAEFNGYAMVLFALQFNRNLPYRKLCEARGITPDDVTHWHQIPAVPAAAFKEWELTCLPPEQRTAVFHSSGTTEQKPSRHFHNAESLAIYEASLWPWFKQNVVPDLQITNYDLHLLTPPPAEAPSSSLVHMCDTIRRKLQSPVSAFHGSVASDGPWALDFQAVLDALQHHAPRITHHVLIGTAFSFVHLLDFMTQRNLRLQLPPGSVVMETGGYKGRSRNLPKPELHTLITQRLGMPPSHIICEYGMSELSSQAYDTQSERRSPTRPDDVGVQALACPDGTLKREFQRTDPAVGAPPHASRAFHFPPWARAQIVSPETGLEVADCETGLIRVFDLANVFSAMAIQTEDLGIRRGDGFELLGRAEHSEVRGCSLMVV